MSNSKEPKTAGQRSPGMLQAPAPRQKLRSRRDSSAEPKYATRRTQAERSETTRKQLLVVAVLTYVNEVTFAQSTRRAQLARTSGDQIEEIIKDAQDFFLGDYFFIELAIAMSDESTRRLRHETHQFT